MNWLLLQNSLITALAATLLAGLFGLAAAIWVATLPVKARRWIFFLAVVPLIWPPFLVINCWLNLLGETGVWRSWFPYSILSRWGAIWVLALLKWPIVFLFASGALGRLDPRSLTADMRMTSWALFRWILWPQVRASLRLSALITFVLCLAEFSIPSILQVKVFTTEVWLNFNTTFNYAAVVRESWPLLVAPAAVLLVVRASEIPLEWRGYGGCAALLSEQGGWMRSVFGLVAVVALGFSVLLPMGQLALEGKTWRELWSAWSAGTNATMHSLLFGFEGAVACLGLGLALHRSRFGGTLWIPFFLPGVLLGIALAWTLNHPLWRSVAQSSAVVAIAFALRYGALAWLTLRQLAGTVPVNLREDAILLGAGRWFYWRHLFWPAHGQRVLFLGYAVYLLALWDVETLIMIVPAGGETLALRVFNLLHYGHNGQVNALCMVLLGVGVAPLAIVLIFERLALARKGGC
jgi:iron(III) transport system permease protein